MLTENDISYSVRGASFKVYNTLGPGLLESVYEYALAYELSNQGFMISTQVPLPVIYEGKPLKLKFRIDIIINNLVIIEAKSVESISDLHYKQLLTYLKLSGFKLGLLINFNTPDLAKSIIRIVNNL
jgi:GxxExxY protein